jgi:hypothetical protein
MNSSSSVISTAYWPLSLLFSFTLCAALLCSLCSASLVVNPCLYQNCTVPFPGLPALNDLYVQIPVGTIQCTPYSVITSFSSQPTQWLLTGNCAGGDFTPNIALYYYTVNGSCPRQVSAALYPPNVSYTSASSAGQCQILYWTVNNGTTTIGGNAYSSVTCNNVSRSNDASSYSANFTRSKYVWLLLILALLTALASD